MLKKLKKIQNLIRDLLFNTLGFGIYIATQQILLMPIMARILPEEDFAKVVLYISVFAIITNTNLILTVQLSYLYFVYYLIL